MGGKKYLVIQTYDEKREKLKKETGEECRAYKTTSYSSNIQPQKFLIYGVKGGKGSLKMTLVQGGWKRGRYGRCYQKLDNATKLPMSQGTTPPS